MPDTTFPGNRKKWPKVIAFDTSGPHVSIGWATQSYSGGTLTEMPRGQAEALFPAMEEMLVNGGWAWSDIDAIGVGVGPGNFTGIRISVSAARGLGLALGIPVFGLTTFELVYGSHRIPAGTLVSVAAPRDMAYVQGFGAGGVALPETARLIDPANPPADLQLSGSMQVLGHRAEEIASHFEALGRSDSFATDPARMAETTEFKYLDATAFPPRPAPLYLKPADAAPARDAAPVILP